MGVSLSPLDDMLLDCSGCNSDQAVPGHMHSKEHSHPVQLAGLHGLASSDESEAEDTHSQGCRAAEIEGQDVCLHD
jgi:hypothetical protein